MEQIERQRIEMHVEVGDSVSAKDAEAWAVGTRHGVDVPSTDPTYHNNAKYYAEHAESSAEGVDESAAAAAESAAAAAEDAAAAAGAAASAATAAGSASGSAEAAAGSAEDAAESQAAAAGSATAAAGSAAGAAGAAQAAETAQDAAETAQEAAEAAQAVAQAVAAGAAQSAEAAAQSATDAATAKAGAESAQSAAAGSATAAAGSASDAASSKTAAAGSATAAAGSASAAAASQTAAAGSATAAAGSAQAAQDVLDSIPEDYSQMSADVTELKTAIKTKAPAIYPTASGTIATFPDGADGMPVKSLAIALVPIQEGSGDPSPENVRPITGHSGTVNVYRTGKNIFNLDDVNRTTGRVSVSGTTISKGETGQYVDVFNGTQGSSSVATKNLFLQAGTYTVSGAYTGEGALRVYSLNADNTVNTYLTYIRESTPSASFTMETPGRVTLRFTGTTSVTVSNLQIEPGSTATAYEPHIGTTYPVTLPTSAGTVYGGTLDPVRGTLTVDRVMFSATSCYFVSTTSSGIQYAYVYYPSSDVKGIANDVRGISSAYKVRGNVPPDSGWFRMQSSYILVYDNRFTDKETADSILASEQPKFCYYLDTPFAPVTITTTEIQTLLGYNAVWSDAGAVSVEYPADTKLYIDRGQSEDDMTANATIARGQYFQIGTAVYKALDTILTGEQIIPGTNATPTTTAEALNQLITRQGGMWELIKSETFTNATAGAHDITTDDNNQPFELTDIRIMIALPKQDTASAVASYGQIRAYYDSSNYDRVQVGAVSMNAQDALKCSQCEILQEDGMIIRNGGTFNTAGNRWGFTFSNEATPSKTSHWQLCDPKRVYSRIYVESVTGTCMIQVFGKRKL